MSKTRSIQKFLGVYKERVAVFGGSFDPPTGAHIALVKKVLKDKTVDRVMVCPSYNHRDKGDQSDTYLHRLSMCNLAFRDIPQVTVHSYDFTSCIVSDGEGVGSTFNLLKTIGANLGLRNRRYYLLMGVDCFRSVRTWYKGEALLHASNFIVTSRDGSTWDPLERAFFKNTRSEGVEFEDGTSSTLVRKKIKESLNLNETPNLDTYMVKPVSDYIQKVGLYGLSPTT